MSRIVLARHGESEWHVENRYAGRADIALTENGRAQARALGEWAAGLGNGVIGAVWSSPLRRARETAMPAAELLHLPLQIDDRLAELDFGDGEGLTEAEMRARFPKERAAFEQDPVTHPLPGGSSPVDAAEQAFAALHDIDAQAHRASMAPGARTLVVAHSTILRLLLCRMLSIPLARYRSAFPVFRNDTVTEVELTPERASLLSFQIPVPAWHADPASRSREIAT